MRVCLVAGLESVWRMLLTCSREWMFHSTQAVLSNMVSSRSVIRKSGNNRAYEFIFICFSLDRSSCASFRFRRPAFGVFGTQKVEWGEAKCRLNGFGESA